MKSKLLATVFVVGLSVFGMAQSANALVISDTQDQIQPPTYSQAVNDIATFDFTSDPYLTVGTITNISIRMTLYDGDTKSGEFDFNDFHLSLDGFDTGIALNGFENELLVTLTIGGTPSNAGAIRDALIVDGELIATFTDADNEVNGLGSIGPQNTTLTITYDAVTEPVPEPGTLALFGLGLAGLGFARRRKTA